MMGDSEDSSRKFNIDFKALRYLLRGGSPRGIPGTQHRFQSME